MSFKSYLCFFLTITSQTLFAQNFKPSADPKLQSIKFTVKEDTAWDSIFHRTKGWFGADGAYSFPTDGINTPNNNPNQVSLFLFSDSMIGEVVDHKATNLVMPHNTVAYIKGKTPSFSGIKFYWDTTATGKPESMFIPKTPNTKPGDYFWLGDGFVDKALNNTTYIFGFRIHNTKGGAGFEEAGNVLIALPKGSKPPFKNQRQMDDPFYFDLPKGGHGQYGAAIFNNSTDAKISGADGYVYVYGVYGWAKTVSVARVKPADFEHFDQWVYFDGKGWNKDITRSAEIADHASNEMSVSRLQNGLYAMIFQVDGISTTVGMRLAKTPYGPFGPVIKLYNSDKSSEKAITYNAKAHPSLSKPGELLISYDVNFTDFFNQLKVSPDIYRPRFIRVKFN